MFSYLYETINQITENAIQFVENNFKFIVSYFQPIEEHSEEVTKVNKLKRGGGLGDKRKKNLDSMRAMKKNEE